MLDSIHGFRFMLDEAHLLQCAWFQSLRQIDSLGDTIRSRHVELPAFTVDFQSKVSAHQLSLNQQEGDFERPPLLTVTRLVWAGFSFTSTDMWFEGFPTQNLISALRIRFRA